MEKILLPLSADPPTKGHINLIHRTSKLCHNLYVVLFINDTKNYMLDSKERLKLLKENFSHLKSIHFDQSDDLVASYALKKNIPIIVRGFRNAEDLEYEKIFEEINSKLWESLEVLYLRSHSFYEVISSTAVRTLLKQGLLMEEYVPLNVKEALERKQQQYLIGITGSISVGKSTVGMNLIKNWTHKKIEAHYIDLDQLVRHIYDSPLYTNFIQKVSDHFGKDVLKKDGKISQKKLSEKIYSSPNSKKNLEDIQTYIHSPLLFEIREALKGKKGFIFLDGAVLLERGYSHIVNGNILLVHCSFDTQLERLCKRNAISKKVAIKKIALAGSFEDKKKLYKDKKDKWGQLWTIPTDEKLESHILHVQKKIEDYFHDSH